MCLVCTILLYRLFCGMYGVGDLKPVGKKGFGSFGHCSGISLPAWWRDWMWNCLKGSNMLSCCRGLSRVIDSAIVPDLC